jgi:hypothetical protein
MKSRILTVLCFVAISIVGTVFGGWPEPAWRVLPKLEFIHDAASTIWFYSSKYDDDRRGFSPLFVVTYSKFDKEVVFQPVIHEGIFKDGMVSFYNKVKPLPSYLHIEPEEIQLWGASIPVPEMAAEDLERMSEWSVYLHSNRHMEPSEFGISNAFSGSFIDIKGLYYFGLQGGMFEGNNHMGGLAVYYPSEEKIEVLRSKYLVGCSVIGIKQIGDELALSTADRSLGGIFQGWGRYWDEGEQHRTGLVLYDMNTKKWRNISFSVPSTFIREMAVIDGQVWMTTNLGISRYDRESDEMNSWNWDIKLKEQP